MSDQRRLHPRSSSTSRSATEEHSFRKTRCLLRSLTLRLATETVMAHPLFGPEVRLMLQENDSTAIQAFAETLHPATVAETLEGEFSVEDVWKFLSHTGIKTQAAIFEYFPLEWQVRMVEGSGQPQVARLIEK